MTYLLGRQWMVFLIGKTVHKRRTTTTNEGLRTRMVCPVQQYVHDEPIQWLLCLLICTET